MKILALSLDTYGDQVLRQPLLSALLDDGHRVTLAIRREYAGIVPFLDTRLETLACDVAPDTFEADPAVALAANAALVERMKQAGADAVIALPFNRTALDDAILIACAGVLRFALVDDVHALQIESNGIESASTDHVDVAAASVEHPVRVAEASKECEKNVAMFRAVAGKSSDLPAPRLHLPLADGGHSRRLAASLGLEPAQFAVMAALSPPSLKAMPTDLAVDTIVWLQSEHKLRTLLAGVEKERPHIEALCELAARRGAKPVVYIGDNARLGDLLELVQDSRAYVGADTGTMHFAAALGLPVAALFGGGHFPRFQPQAAQWFATTKRLLCFGCDWKCIYDSRRCIHEVDRETWFAGISRLLAGESPGWIFANGSIDSATAATAGAEFRTVVRMLGAVEHDRARRLDVIGKLDAERGLLARTAEERLEIVNKLNAENQVLDLAARQRLEGINRLTAIREDQQRQIETLQETSRELQTAKGALRAFRRAVARKFGRARSGL